MSGAYRRRNFRNKKEIDQRKNRKLNIKLRTFLDKLGYKRRNSLLIDKVNQCLEKNSLALLVKRADTDWSTIRHRRKNNI